MTTVKKDLSYVIKNPLEQGYANWKLLGGNMTEYTKDLTSLIKNRNSTIIISDEQVDETGKIVREPVLVFSVGGEKIGYVPTLELERWMRIHIYASSFLEKISTFEG